MIDRTGKPIFSLAGLIVFMTTFMTCSVADPCRSFAHHPDSEFVQAMVRPAVERLKGGKISEEYGAEAIVALALVKAGTPADNRRVVAAIEQIQGYLRTRPEPSQPYRMYSISIALLLLCEVNKDLYKDEIQQILDLLLARQKPSGGWSYMADPPNRSDVSQTQYCCLALWTADKCEFRVPPDAGRRALVWLMSVQDLRGGWPYKGIYTTPFARQNQGGITPSVTAAGLGSVYVTADWLGYGRDPDAAEAALQSENLPSTVSLVVEGEEERDEQLIDIDEGRLRRCQNEGATWFGSDRDFVPDPPAWPLYYLYAFERYAAFRDKAAGVDELEPAWYNIGAEYLATVQNQDGSWSENSSEATNDVATAFALLFLLRGTRKSLGPINYTDGMLQGGQGLRDDAETAMRADGSVVSIPIAKDLATFMGMLENPDEDELAFFAETVSSLDLDDPSMSPTQQRAMLFNLINHENWAVREIVVKTLGSQARIENVPALIYALGSDPRMQVKRLANDGLKFISRRLDGMELPESPSREDIVTLKQQWEDWFLGIYPEGQLLD